MRKLLLILTLIIIGHLGMSQGVKLGLFYGKKINTIQLKVVKGRYLLWTPDGRFQQLILDNNWTIKAQGDSIVVTGFQSPIYAGNFIRIVQETEGGNISLGLNNAQTQAITYPGSMEIRVANNELRVVQKISDLEYEIGVVSGEGGSGLPLEYYKVQAILAGTYAFKNKGKHGPEGFDVCDQTHCQVFKATNTPDASIVKACELVKHLIVIDTMFNPIEATYHSNCGGMTVNSEDVWNKEISYLRAVQDTFCLKGRNHGWTTKIPVKDWLAYLQKKGLTNPPVDSTGALMPIYFNYELSPIYYYLGDFYIFAKTVRKDWNLKSAKFNVIQEGDILKIDGIGYGHGVGLCQEGAIEMARKGYAYKDILKFYFKTTSAINKEILD